MLGIQFRIPMFGQMTSNIKHGIKEGVYINIITVLNFGMEAKNQISFNLIKCLNTIINHVRIHILFTDI